MKTNKGFTLFEILIVIGIIAAVMVVAFPRLKKDYSNARSVARDFMVLTKEIRHYARLKNTTYRLVLNLDEKDSSYYVEASSTAELIHKNSNTEKKDKDDEEKKSPFQKVDRPLKKEKHLPANLFFKSVESDLQKKLVTEGPAYVYFSPEGLVEKSIIQITDGKNTNWSLVINPLTGRIDIVEKPVSFKDLEAN